MNTDQIILWATPIIVPLVIGIARIIFPKIPSKWLPVAAPILGAAIDLIANGALGAGTAWGALLGSAGVGLREVFDQWTKPKDGTQVGKITGCLFLLVCLGLCGCAMVTQKADTQNPDGSRKTSLVRGYSIIQSSQIYKSAQAQNGEVQRVGVSEVDQKSETARVLEALGPLLEKAAIGTATAMTGYGGVQTPRIVYVTNYIVLPTTNAP